jgi:hypothetical protein
MRLIEQQDITSTEPALPYSHRFNFEYYKKKFGVLPMSHRNKWSEPFTQAYGMQRRTRRNRSRHWRRKKTKRKGRLSLLQLAAQQIVLVVHKLLNNKCLVMWRRTATPCQHSRAPRAAVSATSGARMAREDN